ncbi:putative methyltransferase [Winogradskyella wandonensis]|uniref:Putative methyltransferase n=1 Tax=Winogradskyella wandonensis TaxID=1442586 RepID=A0A4R1KWY8_9FLAO|nr:RsmD family RNA methyltransferase [Winogradskyella wandonensis]TCK69153.1 putative methyltransferase [Winogradskyella wandonensis]
MNSEILNTEIQAFINKNLKADINTLLLKGIPFSTIDSKTLVAQIEAKKRCEKKLPTWYNSQQIYYPNKLNIEQTSSEATANYKANLVSGESLIDITGGFGVDTFYFSKQIKKVTHCEIDTELSQIVKHNYKKLKVNNIECLNENGIDALKRINQQFDWLYVDPSRRDNTQKKVFLLTDCEPNVKTFQGLFLKYSENVMVKTSPLLDLKATLSDLNHVKEIHIVALNNEVKELLWILERDYKDEVLVKSVNLRKETQQLFDFMITEESRNHALFSLPLTYLYEPNVSILKAGAFNTVSAKLNIPKLHQHSHLYTSKDLIDFPGRRFKIEKQIPFNKKSFAKEKISKANVTTRNFPLSVGDIRKKLKIKDGGSLYLFFTTNFNDEKLILICSKI